MNKKLVFLIILFVGGVMTSYAQPKIWNINSVSEKHAFKNSEASKYVIRSADKELSHTIITVMDKAMLPPSGDKHDYMSMGRYWWPNPATKDGLPYIRKDGQSNPEIDKLDRIPLSKMTSSVRNLALAYYLTKDEKYAKKAVDNIRKWFIDSKTKMNPHLNYGQTVPGRNDGMGRGFGIIDTYSFVEMLEGIEILQSSKSLKPKDIKALKEWFSSYLDWMLTSPIGKEEYTSANNHGTAYDVQVVRFALFVDRLDVAKEFITSFPERRLFTQIEPDGSQPLELARTTAFGYSVFNLHHIVDMCYLAKEFDIDIYNLNSEDGRSIAKAMEFLLPYAGQPIDTFPYQQIRDWDKVQQDYALLLYRADNLTNSTKYENYYSSYITSNIKNIDLLIY